MRIRFPAQNAWDVPQVPPTDDLAGKLRWLGYVNRNGGW